ncbi:S-adenosyl-L-methionine-dependent methyltransferase [Polychaeton citri CBS 116435]|uniref:S-adenosyl-L-methionine-dependent methyltransferase n=1 Tax=Polychaeton citri CBS 116435 TaxID=1314669 RepID=A0A9P4QBL9_9PEZI|nr:S-adenosyl-L-methionine-dependent methyltransferase [Polychaeton citri CBS 116435]
MRKAERDAVIEHATQIKQLVHDPSSFLTELHIQQQQYYSIQWLTYFNVLSQIPLPPQAIPYDTVAAKTKVPRSTLCSVARMAMTTDFLCETPDGSLCHSDLSKSFVVDAHLRTQLKHMFNATIPVMAGLVQATERWGHTRAPNETAYNIANDTNLPFFAHLKARPELQKNFEDYMKSRAISHTGSSVEYLLDAFDWEALGRATVIDVGGSSGSTAMMLATAHPRLNVVIQDLAGPIASAQNRIVTLPEDIQCRVQAFEHDFFQPQPEKGADVYLLRTILHDWPDADAVRILKGLVDAMAPSSRLLIMDMVLPKPGSGSLTQEAALRQKDLMMIGTFNAKEREVEEWSALLEEADARLNIRSIKRPAGSELSVIEVSLQYGKAVGDTVNGEHNSTL